MNEKIDRLIAEGVMGWIMDDRDIYYWESDEDDAPTQFCFVKEWHDGKHTIYFSPTSDYNHTGLVLERIEKDFWHWKIYQDFCAIGVELYNGKTEETVYCPKLTGSVPEAVALTVCKAYGLKVEE